MGELGLNKIFGALLAVALAVLGLREISAITFGGGHHGEHHYETLNEWAEASFHGYRIEIAEAASDGSVVEEIYDLGALMAAADISRGERSFKGKCATCHTIEEGGATVTGPNIFAVVGSAKQSNAGFAYSGALGNTDGDIWTYENLDTWIESPSKYARGTNMAFAGISRDDERASVLAYLASFTPDAPAFPEPLPEVVVEDIAEGAVDGAGLEETAGEDAETDAAVIDASAPVVEDVSDAVEEAAETVIDTAVETIEDVTETIGEEN